MIVVAEGRIVVECFLDLLDNLIIGLSLLPLFASHPFLRVSFASF
jgi:hypothetical protein